MDSALRKGNGGDSVTVDIRGAMLGVPGSRATSETRETVKASTLRRHQRANAFLVERLASGPALVSVLKLEAKRNGVSWASVRLARYGLDLCSFRVDGEQAWRLKSPVP